MSEHAKHNLLNLIKKWESLKKTTYLARVARHWVGRAVAIETERDELRRRVEQLVIENAVLSRQAKLGAAAENVFVYATSQGGCYGDENSEDCIRIKKEIKGCPWQSFCRLRKVPAND